MTAAILPDSESVSTRVRLIMYSKLVLGYQKAENLPEGKQQAQ